LIEIISDKDKLIDSQNSKGSAPSLL
jgi:hypothetical protein